jgi:hypothetical protein
MTVAVYAGAAVVAVGAFTAMLVPSRHRERAEAALVAPDLVPGPADGLQAGVGRSTEGRLTVAVDRPGAAAVSGTARPLCDAGRASA